MSSSKLKRWPARQGCTFETMQGGSGRIWVILGDRRTVLPMHGGRKELPLGLVHKIKKDLGLE